MIDLPESASSAALADDEPGEAGAPGPDRAGALRTAWRHREFRLLLGSFAVSGTGDWLYTVALFTFILDRTGSPGWVAAAAVLRLAPYALLGPLGGALADRTDRRRLMVVLDLVRAALMGVIALLATTNAPVALALAAAVLAAAASVPYRAAVAASTPRVVGEPDLAAANAAEGVVGQLTWFAGPALGAALLTATSVAWAFTVNGLTFLVSAVLVAGVRSAGGRSAGASDEGDEQPAPDTLRHQLAEGLGAIRSSRDVELLTAVVVVVMFAYGFEQILWVLVADERLGTGAEGAGYFAAAVGVGGLLVSPLTGRMASGRRPGAVLAGGVVLLGGPLALLSVVSAPVVAYLLLLGEGAGNIVFEVVLVTLVQRLVAAEVLGRVFGIHDSIGAFAQLAGSGACPVLVGVAGLEATLVLVGGGLVACAVVGGPALLRVGSATTTRADDLVPVVSFLDRLGLFDGADRPVLERLALAVTAEHVPAGGVVLREGDPAEDLFVIRAGRVAVLARGEARAEPVQVNELGPGQWFGEIGIVEGIPRTATVTATEAAVLWRIPGAVFVDALTTVPLSAGARLGVVGRLARTHPSTALRVAARNA